MSPSASFAWLHEPPSWDFDSASNVLTMRPAANTDFWQRTHYGFRADNGHLFYSSVEGPFQMTVLVHFEPLHQYDQAGLMIRISEDCWLKTSVEFEPGRMNRLGAVVTNGGYSDWSTQDLPPEIAKFWLRVDRDGADYTVEASLDAFTWMQIRLARLWEDDGTKPISCGVYACCPKKAGLIARFNWFAITSPVPR